MPALPAFVQNNRLDVLAANPLGRAGEVVQVHAFGVVESQGLGEGVEHAVGDAFETAAFQPCVVLHAHPGEHRDFAPAQSWHPPLTVDRQTCPRTRCRFSACR